MRRSNSSRQLLRAMVAIPTSSNCYRTGIQVRALEFGLNLRADQSTVVADEDVARRVL
ncbi:hypothetical protein Pan181_49840 [Aeoliella mucimassa]|uniref:Uncharacterized protein n=1 Tax=Aeoliella mucimassa TaxID=2527972 RepID=A0A518AVJ2_9BACT|nr:hypothetical protein Pan181_49840 [Aeoliella mucimassa]